ncbi:MAG: tetratricopeptide repeat protein [Thermoanaerobaculia bacterium]
MKRAFTTSSLVLVALLSLVLGITACRSGGGDLSNASTQRRFGVRMAKMNLWREAMFRFRRATQIEPENAMAHNNLAVAYEATGDFDAAAKEYREALRLDRSNEYIQKNYSRYVEFMQRGKKREQKTATPAATATVAPVTGTASYTPPPVPGRVPPVVDVAPPANPPTPPITDTTGTTTTNPPQEGSR